MKTPGIAVKAFVLNEQSRLLLIRRRQDDVHKPGAWEVPGGRLRPGEDPFRGLRRETKEETGLDIDISNPLKIHHFAREDGQVITMITFASRARTHRLRLSIEHTEYAWLDLKTAEKRITPEFREDTEMLRRFIETGIL
jgi:8-oxo-dGTP diphosphatase